MVGWNVHPKQLVAQLFIKDKCFILFLLYLYYEFIWLCIELCSMAPDSSEIRL
jgi:hypothetical protein